MNRDRLDEMREIEAKEKQEQELLIFRVGNTHSF